MTWDLEKTATPQDNNISVEPKKWKDFDVLPITDVFESLNLELDSYNDLIYELQSTLDEIERLSSKAGVSLKTLFPKGYYSLVFIEPEYVDALKSENLQTSAGRLSLDGQILSSETSKNAEVNATLDMFKKTFSITT